MRTGHSYTNLDILRFSGRVVTPVICYYRKIIFILKNKDMAAKSISLFSCKARHKTWPKIFNPASSFLYPKKACREYQPYFPCLLYCPTGVY